MVSGIDELCEIDDEQSSCKTATVSFGDMVEGSSETSDESSDSGNVQAPGAGVQFVSTSSKPQDARSDSDF